MFRVRAEFRQNVEIASNLERVREYFADLGNFARLIPGVETIDEEPDGVMCWRVCVDVSLIGTMRGAFRVVQVDDDRRRIEWGPASIETQNLLRYAIGFEEPFSSTARIRMAQRVELRRGSASDLHMMAGLLGATRISAGLAERLRLMMTAFLKRARLELET